jgi:FAD/FMN-containing dehydrogenase
MIMLLMQPGVFYRDFEAETLKRNRIMPTYTASKNICAVGGMFGNNAGGEKSIKYGKMENFILETRMIFSDGNEYVVKPLNQQELETKMSQGDFEGGIYKSLFDTLDKNYDAIKNAKPKVSKNSAGYYLWNVYDKETGLFDMNRLLVGSQGTLGIMVEQNGNWFP